MKPLRLLLLTAIAAGLLAAQTSTRWAYVSGYTAPSATSASVSIALASDDTRDARALGAVVTCPSAECSVTFKRGGTISGGSDIAENKLTGTTALGATVPTAQAEAKSGVTVTGGTSLPGAQPISAGGPQSFEVSDILIVPGESASVEVSSSSAQNITVVIKWEEIP